MNQQTSPVLKFEYQKKIDMLKSIRHEMKRKRFLLDESVDKFGFDELTQLAKVAQKSQIKGWPFMGSKVQSKVLKGIPLGLKIMPVETKYEKFEHPSNLEFIALKELTDNIVCKNISPHIAFYIATQKVSNKSRALKPLNIKRLEIEEKIRSHSNILVSEFVTGGSLDNWVYDIYENDGEISDTEWKGLVFQLVYTIAIIQQYYKMMHNDFHYGNILIDTSIKAGGYFVYETNNKKYYVKNTGFIPKLWDFEFSMIYSNKIADFYPNKYIVGNFEHDRSTHFTKEPIQKTPKSDDDTETETEIDINVPYNYNEVYDLHYFLTSLLDLYISQDLFDWIVSLYPEELIPKEEYTEVSSEYDGSTNDSQDSGKETVSSRSSKSSSSSRCSKSSSSDSSDSKTCGTSDTGSYIDTDSSVSDYDEFLSEGRMRNGVEKQFDLPTPVTLLSNKFFECLTEKPDDFDEKEAIYFKSNIS